MTYLQLSLIVILASSLMGAHSCTKSELSAIEKAPIQAAAKDDTECKIDSDCTVIKSNCCGCFQGGKQKALAKSMEEEELKKLTVACAEVMCMQMISTDQSCKQKPACRSGRCVLE